MQTRRQSLVEVTLSTLAGFGMAMGLQVFLAWAYGVQMTLQQNFEWTVWFTVLSLVRSYLFRRFFNWLHGKQNDTAQRTLPSQDHDRRGGAR